MKLTYRGQAYDLSAPARIGAASTDPSRTKLIYRGQTYDATLCPAVDSAPSADLIITLIYRGVFYQRILKNQKSFHAGQAINWCHRFGQ